ncbi:PQQ-binding-like beta-propeller repeat protein [Syntrophotalea acetylenica]|uniref:Uncharacterized protein n=2 Tax=Syntrophotalea acetylenica TaxID=29542 RepID=A0A1L3GCS7_SYNAC|nr:PQQ-binding-like beta-propeller repeat protein [Syntrophotalea acetylenica]APG23742.1 hypothetical protein A7E75_00910 [Syntrophotalea acetylenica]
MKVSIVARASAVIVSLFILASGYSSAIAESIYPVAALPIPNSSILPNQKISPVPMFIGETVTAKAVTGTTPVPQNPFMAENPWNCMHNDSYQSDVYPTPGPLGSNPVVSSTWLGPPDGIQAIVVGMTFDRANNLLIAASIKVLREQGFAFVQLTLIDATTLATLARFDLPRETLTGTGFRPAGTYFYMAQDNRIVIGTKDRTIWLVSYSFDSPTGLWSFHHDNEAAPWDLTAHIPQGDSIQGLQPDWSGLLWFTSKGGVVGTLDMDTGLVIDSLQLPGERIVNGHAAGEEGGVYIASTLAMYRFDADSDGAPSISWRKTYDAGTHIKEGQTDIGTGTTPTLMGDRFVTITDNGQPQMHVLVYDRADGHLVCSEPVFQPGQASNENSLVATDTSIIVENNFGYKNALKDTTHGRTTTPGLARIDVENDACRTVWTNESESIPTLITKMSLATGLIYTYTKPKGPAATDPWYFTAIDFETGETVWKILAGVGVLYNNHYAGAYLGPDGTLYVGVLGGIVAVRDGE